MKLKPFSVYGDPDKKVVGYNFWCPGCNTPHSVRTIGEVRWEFNGNVDAPTFAPSILVYEVKAGPQATLVEPGSIIQPRCHSFVVDGKIQFLSDCGHKLAGQTVDIPEWESRPQ